MRRINKELLFLLLLTEFGCIGQHLLAQTTINAASCNASDVQNAFNSVTASTTTVNIPACSGGVSWTTQVTLTVPSGNTSLSVMGAGSLTTTGGGDQTVIDDNYASDNPFLLITTGTSSSFFRLAGISFVGGSTAQYGMINVAGNSQNVRIDHSHITPSGAGTGMRLVGCIYGVADHNIIDMVSGSTDNAIQEYQGPCNGDSLGLGAGAWAAATGLGTSSSFYLENNVFNNGCANDCYYGGRYVFRYNTFNNTSPPPAVQTHPTDTGGSGGSAIRGCRSFEIYENTFNPTVDNLMYSAIWLSSGTGVVWGNTASSSSQGGGTGYANFISGHEMREDNGTYTETAPPNGWGYCGTEVNGTRSNWDQNSNTTTGYACLDQLGRGIGDLLVNQFPNVTNNATGCTYSSSCAWPRQAVEPVYEWMDSWSPVPYNSGSLWNQDSTDAGVQNNRDYFLWCNSSSQSGCTSFNGTQGVGSGTLSARPSTCTQYVAYWATDTNTLYQCSSTNTWTSYYTPYTYPHPLTQTGASPDPPTDVVATPH